MCVSTFEGRLADDPDFRRDVFGAVAHRFSQFEQLVEDVALTGFDARLARVLLRLASDGTSVEATHEQLARETASGRAFVSRKIAEFARDGLVDPQRGHIVLLDSDRLEQIATGKR